MINQNTFNSIQLHTDAEKNFNLKAEQLLEVLSDCSSVISKPNQWSPNIPSRKLSSNEVGDVKYRSIDYRGEENAKYFFDGKNILGFKEVDYQTFSSLAQNIQRTKALKNTVSLQIVKEILFEWIELSFKKKISDSFSTFLIRNCSDKIKSIEIWIPISMLFLESDLTIGKIKLKTISTEILEKWHHNILNDKDSANSINAINSIFQRLKSDITSCAASVINITAEPQRAYELALQETEESLGFLRIFSPATILPDLTSYCIVLGSRNAGITRLMSIERDRLIFMEEKMQISGTPEWYLSNDLISTILNTGLDALNNVLQNDKKTAFQKTVISSLKLYSRCSIGRDIAEKLIYIFAALESMFLKNNSEPIQQNISERMAIFKGGTLKEKKEFIANFKTVYSLRSSFVHHGYEIESLKELKNFMEYVWVVFVKLIKSINRFESKESFIDAIEEKKFT
jgi:hypothetical protein